jgi:transcription elongation factor S-II
MAHILAHSDSNQFRGVFRGEFLRLLGSVSEETSDSLIVTGYSPLSENLANGYSAVANKLAENLEKGVFNFAIKEAGAKQIIKKWQNPLFCEIYSARMKSVLINLKKNPTLLASIRSGEVTPEQFAFMTHLEMNPEQWKDRIEKKIKRDRLKFTNNVEASTDMFSCSRCKSKKCTYYEMQTRSADEPTTVFVTCLNCGKNWKN